MGDIAEMVLEGILCECCGVFIDEDYEGIPRHCGSCEEASNQGSPADPLEITYVWNCNCGYQGNRSVLEGTEVHGDDFFRGTCAGCGKKKDVIVPKFDVNDA